VIQERDTSVQNFLVNKKLLETIRVEDGELFHLEYHQLRLERSCAECGIILQDILSPPKEGLFRCRVVYDANSCDVSYHPYTKRSISQLKVIEGGEIEYSKKYLDRTLLEALFLQKGSADDVLILKHGLITDTTIANVAFLYKGRWITPKEPLLNGTTRMRLIAQKRLDEAEIALEDLSNFEAMALMNAMIDFDIIRNKKIEDMIC